jgi:hypothetical protein
VNGSARVSAHGEVTVEVEPADPEATRRMREFLESLAWHRAQRNVGKAESQAAKRPLNAIAFAHADRPSTARGVELVPLEDPFASRFFIRDGNLAAAARQMGERRQSISILNAVDMNGRRIPTQLSVSFWDLNGQLLESESESRQWVDVGGYMLPGQVRVVKTEAKTPFNSMRKLPGGEGHWETFEIAFSQHELLSAQPIAK